MKGRRIGRYVAGWVLLAAGSAPRHAAGLGTAFTYQGQLQQSGSLATGSCDFQFTLFDAAGSGAPPTGGTQVGNTVAQNNASVSGGLFTLQLDFGVSAFSAGNDRWLQVAVRCPAGGGSFQVLAPRQPLTPAPYALFAGVVADGSVTSTKIGAGAVTTSQLATNAVTTAQIADGTITGGDLANGAVSTTKIGDAQVTAAKLAAPLSLTSTAGGSVVGAFNGISTGLNSVGVSGTANNGSNAYGLYGLAGAGYGVVGSSTTGIGVLGRSSGGAAARGIGSTGAGVVGDSDHGDGVRGTSRNGVGVVGQGTNAPGVTGTSDEDGVYGLSTGDSLAGVHGAADAAGAAGVKGDSTNGSGVVGQSENGVGVKGLSAGSDGVYGESSLSSGFGVHGVANTGVAARGVAGESTNGAGVIGQSESGTGVLGVTTSGDKGIMGVSAKVAGIGVHGVAHESRMASSDADLGKGVMGESESGIGVLGNSTQNLGVVGVGGDVGVTGRASTSSGIGVVGAADAGAGSDAVGTLGSCDGGDGVRGTSLTGIGVHGVTAAISSFTNAAVVGEATGDNNIGVRGVANTGGGAWGTFGESAHGAAVVGQSTDGTLFLGLNPAVKFRVTAAGTVFADGSYNCGLNVAPCFNSGAGADLAERIDTTQALHPGDLVEIDPDRTDHYRLATTAYSTLVAGIVSTTPGMTMNNNDLSDNDTNVRTDTRPLLALVGKVPVRATAEAGAIHPGDLLVASSTPGHAMRAAANPSAGSVVGKALESLDGGSGVIKALVMLR